jgi:hypothetical protein
LSAWRFPWDDPLRWTADRIGAAADRDPESPTAQSGFDERAEAAADRNDPYDDYDE